MNADHGEADPTVVLLPPQSRSLDIRQTRDIAPPLGL